MGNITCAAARDQSPGKGKNGSANADYGSSTTINSRLGSAGERRSEDKYGSLHHDMFGSKSIEDAFSKTHFVPQTGMSSRELITSKTIMCRRSKRD